MKTHIKKYRIYPADSVNKACVTAKMATPLSSDSELTEVQLESRRRATKALEGT
jgi:hypothetical protein